MAAAVAAVVLHPGGAAARLLSVAPARALGRISYGVYLWHWPLFLVLNHQRTGLTGDALAVVRIGASLAVAAASYRLIEAPIRWGHRPRRRAVTPRVALAVSTVGLVVSTTVAFQTATPALGLAGAPRLPAVEQAPSRLTAVTGVAAAEAPNAPPSPATAAGAPTSSTAAPAPSATEPPAATRVLLVGDSVATTLGWGLSQPALASGVEVDDEGAVGCGITIGEALQDRIGSTFPPTT